MIAKLKFKSDILKSSNKSILYSFFYKFSYNFCFFVYIDLSKNLSAKYYQNIKKEYRKKLAKRYQNLSKEEKRRSTNMALNIIKFSQTMKNKSLLDIEKNILE